MATVGRARAVVQRWAGSAADVWHAEPRRFPERMGKAVLGRALYGLNPTAFFTGELHRRPFRTWREHMVDGSEFFAAAQALNWASDRRLTADKVAAAERCAMRGIRHAPILAVVGRDTDRHPTAGTFPTVSDAADLMAILVTAPDRLFVKPAGGSKGQGAGRVGRIGRGWSVAGDVLTDRQLAERLLTAPPAEGLLIQPELTNHPEVRALMAGTGLGTLRVLVALTHTGPRVLSAALRIVGSDAPTDNFLLGATGNLAAVVDVPTGRILRVFARRPGRRVLLDNPTHHPVSSVRLTGVVLPLWPETVEFAARAAAAFPEVPVAGLDIAVTEDGPVFMESNSVWSVAFQQLVSGEGIRTTLRRLWPDLAATAAVKSDAARHLRL